MAENASDTTKVAIRQQVWQELRKVARPDSRFHWNFAEFIPDFAGSDHCADVVRGMSAYAFSGLVFITPDNNLVQLREYAIRDQKRLVVSTYGIARGMLLIEPGDVATGDERLAATLDGMEYFGHPISLADLNRLGPFGLLVTGAAVITETGVRWGKGHGYFALEWAVIREVGLAYEETPIVAICHDCQVVSLPLEPSPYDTIVDYIVTPTRVLSVPPKHAKPKGVFWDHLNSKFREQIPLLQELYEMNQIEKRKTTA
jgi:5-formyltetrahydrofolate cyclo-ligase